MSKPTIPSSDSSQLVANPYLVTLMWGGVKEKELIKSKENPYTPVISENYLLPYTLLLLSPSSSSILYYPYLYSNLLSSSDLKKRKPYISSYRIVADLKEFIKFLQKKKYLKIDPTIQKSTWNTIRPFLKEKKWGFEKPEISLSDKQIEKFTYLYEQAEMAMIYACSYIKVDVEVNEIRYQIHDYLQTKTDLQAEIYTQVQCRGGKTYSPDLKSPSLIHLLIVLQQEGIICNFYKTLALNSSSPGKPVFFDDYTQVLKIFKKIIKKITSLKVNTPIAWGRWFPEIFLNPKLQMMVRILTESPGYLPVTQDCIFNLKNNNAYMLYLRHNKCGIIMGASLVVNKDKIVLLDKYGWEYLQFPW